MSIRRTMMAAGRRGGGGGLPAGYTAYDWVEVNSSTGKAAINTEFILDMPRNTTQHRYTIETAFARSEDFAVSWSTRFILTNSSETYDQRITLMKNGATINQLRFRYQCYNGGDGQVTDILINVGEWHNVTLTYQDENVIGGKLLLDGNVYTITTTGGNATAKPLYLLGFTATDEVYPCRMARTKIYDYGVLAADLVPAKRDADNVVGFYDIVRKIFCTPSIEGVQLLCGNGFLPYDAEVEFLQSNGTQYIDIGMPVAYTDVMYIDVWAVNDGGVCGAYQASPFLYANVTISNSTSLGIRYFSSATWAGNNKRTKIYNDANNVYYDNNGTPVAIAMNNTGTMSKNFYLFAYNNNGSASCGSVKIYSFSVTRNGEKIMDMIPVRVGQVGYMYDKVSGRLFGNNGSGDFILGNDIN